VLPTIARKNRDHLTDDDDDDEGIRHKDTSKQTKVQGFEVASANQHFRILTLISIPIPLYHPLGRLWSLTLEAHLTWRFWSIYKKAGKGYR
jgi:hypothetical protein